MCVCVCVCVCVCLTVGSDMFMMQVLEKMLARFQELEKPYHPRLVALPHSRLRSAVAADGHAGFTAVPRMY